MGAEFDHLHSLNEQCGERTMKENEKLRWLILGKQFIPYQNMHALELKDISHPPSNRPHACNIETGCKMSLQLGVCGKNRYRKLLLNAGGGVGGVPLKLCERLNSLVFLCLTQNFLIFNAVRGGVLQMPAISAREHVYKQVLCQNHSFRKCHICKVSIFGRFLFEGNIRWYRWCWVGLGKTRKKHSHAFEMPWLVVTNTTRIIKSTSSLPKQKLKRAKHSHKLADYQKYTLDQLFGNTILHISYKSQDNNVSISHQKNMWFRCYHLKTVFKKIEELYNTGGYVWS